MHSTLKVIIIAVVVLVIGFVTGGLLGPKAYSWIKDKFNKEENEG